MTAPVSSVSAAATSLPAEQPGPEPAATPASTPSTPVDEHGRPHRDRIVAFVVLVLAVAITVALLVPLWLHPASGTVAP